MAQPCIGFLAVDLGGLEQAVELRTGRGALRRVTEEPRLTPNDKRLYRTLRKIVVDRQMAGLDVALQPAPVIRQIVHCLSQHTLRCDLGLRFIQPAFQLAEDRQASFLTTDKPLFIAGILEFAFDDIQLKAYSAVCS